jgi:hypothetical protein
MLLRPEIRIVSSLAWMLRSALLTPGSYDGNEVVALLKDVDGWITSHASRAASEPLTQLAIFQGLLKGKQGVEGIGIPHDHDDSS